MRVDCFLKKKNCNRVEGKHMALGKHISASVALTFTIALLSALFMVGCSGFFGSSVDDEDATSFTVTDADGNAKDPATDKNIVMTLAGDKDTYVLVGEDYIESGCQAFSKKSGVITSPISVEGTVDTSTPGNYEIEYMVTTKKGKKATAKRNVHVVRGFDKEAENIPVLMYHYVYSADDKPANLDANYLLDTKLAEQCKYLKDNDYYFPSFQELRAWVDGKHTLPAKSVILTFDDAQTGFFKHGVPVLEKYKVPATSFVIGVQAGSKLRKYASPYVQYQSHSYNMHRPGGGNIGRGGVIYAYSSNGVTEDIKSSNKITGNAVAFAYPFGDYDEKAKKGLKDAGIICAFTIVNSRIHQGDDPLALNRVRISGDYSTESYKYLVAPNA